MIDEVDSLEQLRRIRDIIYQCCIDYVSTIEYDKNLDLNATQIHTIKKHLNNFASSIFEKARQEIQFFVPKYEKLPMEPVSVDLIQRVSELEALIEEKRAQVILLRREVPEAIRNMAKSSLEFVEQQVDASVNNVKTQEECILSAKSQHETILEDVSKYRQKRTYQKLQSAYQYKASYGNSQNGPFPEIDSSDISDALANQTNDLLTSKQYYTNLIKSLALLPDSNDLAALASIRKSIIESVHELHTSVNDQILSTQVLTKVVIENS